MLKAKAEWTRQHARNLRALNDPAADAVFSLAQELEAQAGLLEQAAKSDRPT